MHLHGVRRKNRGRQKMYILLVLKKRMLPKCEKKEETVMVSTELTKQTHTVVLLHMLNHLTTWEHLDWL